jgi:hypothetical protein
MVMVWTFVFVGGADMGGSSFADSHRLRLLDLDVAGESLSAGADVEVDEALAADAVPEVGREPSKTNLVLVPVDMGLMKAGDSVLRKSR